MQNEKIENTSVHFSLNSMKVVCERSHQYKCLYLIMFPFFWHGSLVPS